MKLLERVAAVAVRRRLAKSTIACYSDWIVQFLRFSRAGDRWRLLLAGLGLPMSALGVRLFGLRRWMQVVERVARRRTSGAATHRRRVPTCATLRMRLGLRVGLTQQTAISSLDEPSAKLSPRAGTRVPRGSSIQITPNGGPHGSPAVRVCYDPGNVAYYEGVRPEPDLPVVADLVRAVCIKDHRGSQAVEDFPTPGDGDIDHVAIFRTLRAARFAGPCLIERIDGLASPEEVDRELARGRAYLERAVAEATGASGG